MNGEKKNNILSQIVPIITIIVSLLSISVIQYELKIILIFVVVCLLITAQKMSEHKTKKLIFTTIILVLICVVILITPIFNLGSISSYISQISKTLVRHDIDGSDKFYQERLNNDISNINSNLDKYFFMTENTLTDIENNTSKINDNINNLYENINNLYKNYSFYNLIYKNENQSEISKISTLIQTELNQQSDNFIDIKYNPVTIERFYKMFLSENQFYYCNIIKAFEMNDIECEKLSINEYTLLIWDVELLGLYQNLLTDISTEINQDIFYEEYYFQYNDFKIHRNEYSDKLDYQVWGMTYNDLSADDIYSTFCNVIFKYCHKIYINFQ